MMSPEATGTLKNKGPQFMCAALPLLVEERTAVTDYNNMRIPPT